jgi:type VI secretion system secreted protein Hcp
MAVDMFLKIAEIGGESVDSKHKGEMDVLAWSWGMSQSGTAQLGGGAGAGKVNVKDISVTKYVDGASHALQLACCNGQHLPEATLFVRKAGKNPVEYIKITMYECLISNVSTGGSGGNDRLTENVSMNFAKVKWEYTPQKADGTADATKDYTWNIQENIQQ